MWKAVNDTYVNDKENFEHINFWNLTKSERKRRLKNFKKLIIVRDRVKNSLPYAADVSRFMMRFLGFFVKSLRKNKISQLLITNWQLPRFSGNLSFRVESFFLIIVILNQDYFFNQIAILFKHPKTSWHTVYIFNSGL